MKSGNKSRFAFLSGLTTISIDINKNATITFNTLNSIPQTFTSEDSRAKFQILLCDNAICDACETNSGAKGLAHRRNPFTLSPFRIYQFKEIRRNCIYSSSSAIKCLLLSVILHIPDLYSILYNRLYTISSSVFQIYLIILRIS